MKLPLKHRPITGNHYLVDADGRRIAIFMAGNDLDAAANAKKVDELLNGTAGKPPDAEPLSTPDANSDKEKSKKGKSL